MPVTPTRSWTPTPMTRSSVAGFFVDESIAWPGSSKQRSLGVEGLPAGPRLLLPLAAECDFAAQESNPVALTDLAEYWTTEDTLYPHAAKDASANRIVGHSTDRTYDLRLAVDALESAVSGRGDHSNVTGGRSTRIEGLTFDTELVRNRGSAPRIHRRAKVVRRMGSCS